MGRALTVEYVCPSKELLLLSRGLQTLLLSLKWWEQAGRRNRPAGEDEATFPVTQLFKEEK